jgi:hypothetical protein
MPLCTLKSRGAEDAAPTTDEKAAKMLREDLDSGVFLAEYERLAAEARTQNKLSFS